MGTMKFSTFWLVGTTTILLLNSGSFSLAEEITNKCNVIGNGKGKVEPSDCEANDKCEIKKGKCKNVKVKMMKNTCNALVGDGKGKVKSSDCEANDKCEIKKGKCKNAKPAKIKKIKNKCDAIEDERKIDKAEGEENVECVVNGKKCKNAPIVPIENRCDALVGDDKGKVDKSECEENVE